MSNQIDQVKKVPYNNPSLIPLGSYDIDIRQNLEINLDNHGSYGGHKDGNYSIISKFALDDGKEVIIVDLVTLKKVLDKKGLYPNIKKDEVAALCQLTLTDGEITVKGDIVKVTNSK